MEYIVSVLLSALLVGVGAFFWWRKSVYSYWHKRGVKHVEVANIFQMFYKFYTMPFYETFHDLYKKHGRIFGAFENGAPILYVCDPDLLRTILVKDFHIFSTRIKELPDKNKMLVFLNGEDWKRVRTIITPAFTSRRMRQISHIINECSKTVLETLKKCSESGEPADCKRIFGTFTLDVIANSAFATKIDSLNDIENIFVKEVKKALSPMPMLRALAFFFLPTWAQKAAGVKIFPPTDFFENVIAQVIKERKTTGKKYDDMLQLLLDAQEYGSDTSAESNAVEDEVDQYGSVTNDKMVSRSQYKKLSMEELVAQCVLFFIVGYETTATTLSFMAYCLALNPECQEKLIKEVDSIFEKNQEVNYDVIREMKYLDCVLLETLRMYPAVSRAERTSTESYKIENTDIRIDKDTLVAFNIYSMHHDPEFFPNPETFSPERFLSENANHHPYAYLPFGAGPRNCLGMRFALMEIKLCMCHILRNFRLKKDQTTKIPLDITKRSGLTTVSELPLAVEKRGQYKNGVVL